MSAQDLARAIEALADDEVREAFVAGDRSAFAGQGFGLPGGNLPK